jgi:hypothetical protein
MRYMLLIYATETESGLSREDAAKLMAGHAAAIEEATRKGVLQGAEPLSPTRTATTVRMQDGQALITDGPFAETKEQLAGYYILECADLDEAIEWATKIPSSCKGGEGCIEIRPLPGLPSRPEMEANDCQAVPMNG